MTTITIYNDKAGNHVGIELKGHAGFAQYGSDIVCAAISFLVINTENSIELFTDTTCKCVADEDNGYMKIMLDKNRDSEQVQLLMKTMIHGLETLSKQYQKNVRLKTEEV